VNFLVQAKKKKTKHKKGNFSILAIHLRTAICN